MHEAKEKKRCGCPVGLCGKPQGADLFRTIPVGGIHAVEHGPLHLYLAGRPGPDRGGSKLDGGAKYHPVWLAGLCIGSGRHRAVFHWADVYSPGGLPHSGQYPKKGRSPCDGGPPGMVRLERIRPHPRTAGCGRRRYRDPAGPQPGRHCRHHHLTSRPTRRGFRAASA